MLSKAVRWFLLSLVLPAGLLMGADATTDWPCFRGPNADGMSPETGINKDWKAKPPKVLWRLPMSDGGFAGPSVADGKVFIGNEDGKLTVLKATREKAEVLGEFDTAKYSSIYSTPTFANGNMYMSDRNRLYAVKVK